MNTVLKLDTIISEFDAQQEADSYDTWFRTKVEKAIAGPTLSIPHDEAMVFIEKEIEHRRVARAAR